jgi:hypothetical protein
MLVCAFTAGCAFGQTVQSRLWDMVETCNEAILAAAEEKQPYDSIVDDAGNGFLHIAGSWPTCGCSCASTVGAYRKADDTYVFLKREVWSCANRFALDGSPALETLLPVGLSLATFTGGQSVYSGDEGHFYLDIGIPRKGTLTEARIRLVPLGLFPEGNNGLCFSFEEDTARTRYLYALREFAMTDPSQKAIHCILDGEFDALSAADRHKLDETMGTWNRAGLREVLTRLYTTWKIHQALRFTTVHMLWDRVEGRFRISDTGGSVKSLSFIEFLKQSDYYSPAC